MKMPYKQNKKNIFSIAPMMGKTDAFFCMLLNLINNDVNIYTEMIHAETIIRSNVLDNYKKLDNQVLHNQEIWLVCRYSFKKSKSKASKRIT